MFNLLFMQVMEFLIDPDDCLLLLAIYQAESVKGAAFLLKKDPTVILRRVQRLALESDLVRKTGGIWKLTSKGQTIALWAKEAKESQLQALQAPSTLRIGASATFIERVICPFLGEKPFSDIARDFHIELLCPASGLEQGILRGELDIVFTCARPNDPQIRFRRGVPESWSVVCSKEMAAAVNKEKTPKEKLSKILSLPYLRHKDVLPEELLSLNRDTIKCAYTFDLVSTIRSATISGLGWSLLPTSAVNDELRDKKLYDLGPSLDINLRKDFIGIWWLKENSSVTKYISPLADWMKNHADLI